MLKILFKKIIPLKYHLEIRKIIYKLEFIIDVLSFKNRTKLMFFKIHGYKLNLKNPKSFNEKIFWKKLFDRNPMLVLTTDKHKARDYIKQKIGEEAEDFLIPLLWSGKKAEDIPFDDLPDEYIVKPSHSWGRYIIVENSNKNKKYAISDTAMRYTLNDSIETRTEIINLCKKWLSSVHGRKSYEWAYAHIKPLIIIEKLLKDKNGNIPNDYKFFMFHGKCRMILFCSNRFRNADLTYYDPNWNLLPIISGNPDSNILKPKLLEKMLWISEKLSEDFDFVRVDLYLVDDKVFCGEITHYSGSGCTKITPTEFDFHLGSYWHLS